MIKAAHADTGFLNKSIARSIAGAHIFLSKNEQKPKLNGLVLTIAQIKKVLASAAEADLAALYIMAKKMITLRHTLIEMGRPQPQTPIQADNSTSVGFTNKTIVNRAIKSTDMTLCWLRYRKSQE